MTAVDNFSGSLTPTSEAVSYLGCPMQMATFIGVFVSTLSYLKSKRNIQLVNFILNRGTIKYKTILTTFRLSSKLNSPLNLEDGIWTLDCWHSVRSIFFIIQIKRTSFNILIYHSSKCQWRCIKVKGLPFKPRLLLEQLFTLLKMPQEWWIENLCL